MTHITAPARHVLLSAARGAMRAALCVALAAGLSGCGNCGGWTNPWYRSGEPHSCHADHVSEGAGLPSPLE